jgi:hypothetical protein
MMAPLPNLHHYFWQQAAPASQQAAAGVQQSLLAGLAAVAQQPSTPQQPQVQTQLAQVQLPVSQQKQPGAQQSQQPALVEEEAGNSRPAQVSPAARTTIALSFINMGISFAVARSGDRPQLVCKVQIEGLVCCIEDMQTLARSRFEFN